MSSKRDNSKHNNKKYMRLALNLASQNSGLTGSNPSVGSVIVKNNEIISVGITSIGGRPHSETNAIKNCKHNLKNSTLYVSLEPCNHYGKTPPCTNLIIKSGIKKVYYAIDDIDPRSSSKSFNILKGKKVKVIKNFMLKDAKKLYKSYFISKSKKIPYIIGKIAASNDNYIKSKKKYITNKYSLKVSHLLRYKNDGVLISYKTANSDNPKLNCRIDGLDRFSPKRFIIDKNLKLKESLHLIDTANKYKTYIFYNKSTNIKKKHFVKKGVKLIKMKLNEEGNFNLISIAKKIYSLGINSLLIEGGVNLTDNFIKSNLLNEFYLFKSKKKLKTKGKLSMTELIPKLSKYFRFKENVDTYLENDKLIKYY